MAEYFPLLERAVAGLTNATPEARQAIYERARSALLGQLRHMDPPVPEQDIARESAALDAAIGRLEATMRPTVEAPPDAGRVSAEPAIAAEATPPRPAPKTSAPVRPPIARTARLAPIAPPRPENPPGAPGLPSAQAPAVTAPAPSEAPHATPSAPPAPVRERPALPIRPQAGSVVRRPAAPLRAPEASAPGDRPPAGTTRPSPARPLNTAPRVGIEPRVIVPTREPQAASDAPADAASPIPITLPPASSDHDVAPIAPRAETMTVAPAIDEARDPEEPARRRGPLVYLGAAVGALLVAGIAVQAWRLRDRPEQLRDAQQQQSTTEPSGKVVDRAAGGSPSGSPAPDTAPESASVPAPVAQGSEPQTPQGGDAASSRQAPAPAASPAQSSTSSAPAIAQQTTTPAIGVSERAALLLDAPQEPQKVKTYVGSVVWKTQNVSAGQGQPLSQAVEADIDIPDAKLTMTMVMKRNLEPQFPASHTIEFRFTPEPGSEIGSVKQINVPELRLDDSSSTGDPLAGLPVAITDNYFLVGLSRGNAENPNIQMLERRNWVDVSLLLTSGKVAKITFEKAGPGQRIIDDAVKSWQSGG